MKFAPVVALFVGSASAFTAPSMTFAVGKKSPTKVVKKAAPPPPKSVAKKVVVAKAAPVKAAPVKVAVKKVAPVKVAVKKAVPLKVVVQKAAPKKPVVQKAVVQKVAPKKVAPKVVVRSKSSFGTIPSKAIPYEQAPANLDGSLVGDVGFDPCFLSTKADLIASYFQGIFDGKGPSDGLVWYREAELMNGRIAMVAAVGFLWPGFFGTFAGNEWTGVDAYSYTNPLEALGSAPSAALFQIFAFMSVLEFRRIRFIAEDGDNYIAGNSQRWGQFPGQWNPFGLNYTPEEYEEKALQEIKHARLAMIGLLGLVFQANASGESVADQLRAAFVIPEYASKAGYFWPEGI